jgi:taurine dioxygenase
VEKGGAVTLVANDTTDTPDAAALAVEPIAGRIGAIVHGIDLAIEVSDAEVAAVKDALLLHGVVFFRNQRLTPERQVAFAQRLGPLTLSHPNSLETNPTPVLELANARANHWHSDVSFVDRPPFASLLAHVSTPACGGDTAWASGVAAYKQLPAALRHLADEIDVIHSNQFDYGRLAGDEENQKRLSEHFANNQFETAHPAVRVIPETGEKALYLGGFTTKVVGFSPSQSRAILDLLQAQITHVNNTVRWRWATGDVALWDNRTVQHTAVDDLDDYAGRTLRRVTIAGPLPTGVDGRRSRIVRGDSSTYTPMI